MLIGTVAGLVFKLQYEVLKNFQVKKALLVDAIISNYQFVKEPRIGVNMPYEQAAKGK